MSTLPLSTSYIDPALSPGLLGIHKRYKAPSASVILVLETDREKYTFDSVSLLSKKIPYTSSATLSSQSFTAPQYNPTTNNECAIHHDHSISSSLSKPSSTSLTSLQTPTTDGFNYLHFNTMCTNQLALVDSFSPTLITSPLYRKVQTGRYTIKSELGNDVTFDDDMLYDPTIPIMTNAPLWACPQNHSHPKDKIAYFNHIYDVIHQNHDTVYPKVVLTYSVISQLLGSYPLSYLYHKINGNINANYMNYISNETQSSFLSPSVPTSPKQSVLFDDHQDFDVNHSFNPNNLVIRHGSSNHPQSTQKSIPLDELSLENPFITMMSIKMHQSTTMVPSELGTHPSGVIIPVIGSNGPTLEAHPKSYYPDPYEGLRHFVYSNCYDIVDYVNLAHHGSLFGFLFQTPSTSILPSSSFRSGDDDEQCSVTSASSSLFTQKNSTDESTVLKSSTDYASMFPPQVLAIITLLFQLTTTNHLSDKYDDSSVNDRPQAILALLKLFQLEMVALIFKTLEDPPGPQTSIVSSQMSESKKKSKQHAQSTPNIVVLHLNLQQHIITFLLHQAVPSVTAQQSYQNDPHQFDQLINQLIDSILSAFRVFYSSQALHHSLQGLEYELQLQKEQENYQLSTSSEQQQLQHSLLQNNLLPTHCPHSTTHSIFEYHNLLPSFTSTESSTLHHLLSSLNIHVTTSNTPTSHNITPYLTQLTTEIINSPYFRTDLLYLSFIHPLVIPTSATNTEQLVSTRLNANAHNVDPELIASVQFDKLVNHTQMCDHMNTRIQQKLKITGSTFTPLKSPQIESSLTSVIQSHNNNSQIPNIKRQNTLTHCNNDLIIDIPSQSCDFILNTRIYPRQSTYHVSSFHIDAPHHINLFTPAYYNAQNDDFFHTYNQRFIRNIIHRQLMIKYDLTTRSPTFEHYLPSISTTTASSDASSQPIPSSAANMAPIIHRQLFQHVSLYLISSFHPNTVRPSLQYTEAHRMREERYATIKHVLDQNQPQPQEQFVNHNTALELLYEPNTIILSDGPININHLLPHISYKIGKAPKYGA